MAATENMLANGPVVAATRGMAMAANHHCLEAKVSTIGAKSSMGSTVAIELLASRAGT